MTANRTSIANAFLQDRNLSFAARGIGAMLFSCQNDEEKDLYNILSGSPIETQEEICEAIDELVQNGYIFETEDGLAIADTVNTDSDD